MTAVVSESDASSRPAEALNRRGATNRQVPRREARRARRQRSDLQSNPFQNDEGNRRLRERVVDVVAASAEANRSRGGDDPGNGIVHLHAGRRHDQRDCMPPALKNDCHAGSADSGSAGRLTCRARVGQSHPYSQREDGEPGGRDSHHRRSVRTRSHKKSRAHFAGSATRPETGERFQAVLCLPIATGARSLHLVRFAGLLALEADPVAVACTDGAQLGRHHRYAAGGADRRPLVVHAGSIRFVGNATGASLDPNSLRWRR